MDEENEEDVSIVDAFSNAAGYGDETRSAIRRFWDFFYQRYYVVTRTENSMLRNLFIKAAQYVGVAKGAPDVLRMPLPEGKTRGDLYRELQSQTGVTQEFYNAINSTGIRDLNDAVENQVRTEEAPDSRNDVGGSVLELLDDGDVDGDATTEEVPGVRVDESAGEGDTSGPGESKTGLEDLPPTQPA